MKYQELYNQIRSDICKNHTFDLHFGACANTEYGTDMFSEGIKRMCEKSNEFAELTGEIARRYFVDQDSGDAYAWDEEEQRKNDLRLRRLQGSWDTEYGNVRISWNGPYTVMFFDFER